MVLIIYFILCKKEVSGLVMQRWIGIACLICPLTLLFQSKTYVFNRETLKNRKPLQTMFVRVYSVSAEGFEPHLGSLYFTEDSTTLLYFTNRFVNLYFGLFWLLLTFVLGKDRELFCWICVFLV